MAPAFPEKVELGLLALPKLPPVPLWTLHMPAPTVGALAAKLSWVWPQVAAPVWLGPALAVAELFVKVSVTSLVEAAQGAFEIVQRKV